MMTRRTFSLFTTTALLFGTTAQGQTREFPITKSNQEWKDLLTPAQHAVLRNHRTERAFTNSLMGERSPLLDNNRSGTYICAGCENPLYLSSTKYDSRTGWPSFWDAIEKSVGTTTDRRFFMTRTEVHCAQCGGHLGHIFNDGPEPTGQRHCINGLALLFLPQGENTPTGHPVAH